MDEKERDRCCGEAMARVVWGCKRRQQHCARDEEKCCSKAVVPQHRARWITENGRYIIARSLKDKQRKLDRLRRAH